MTNQFDSEYKEGEPIIYLDIDLDELGKIVDTGIMRASNFSKFIQAEKVENYQINYLNKNSETLFEPDIRWSDEKLTEWNKAYKNWAFCNCLTEILEVFFYFLEKSWNFKEILDNPKRIKKGQRITELFKNIRSEDLLEKWFSINISITDNEKEILRSLFELRHLITHNASIVESRKQLKENPKGIVVNWYNFKFICITESGKNYH